MSSRLCGVLELMARLWASNSDRRQSVVWKAVVEPGVGSGAPNLTEVVAVAVTVRVRFLMSFVTGALVATASILTFLTAWRVDAAPDPKESTIINVEPARILDTRVDIGLPGPFVSATSRKLRVTGSIPTTTGDKVVVPDGATGVMMNVTVDRPSAAGFVSVRPGDAAGPPTTSSLNFAAGEPTANAVQVALPTAGANAGQIELTYDAFGVIGPNTEILIDVVGYTVNSGIQDLEQRLAALESAKPFAVTQNLSANTASTTDAVMLSVQVIAPANGDVTVNSSAYVNSPTQGRSFKCSITTGTTIPNVGHGHRQRWESGGLGDGSVGHLSGTRLFELAAGATGTYNLVCDYSGPGSGNVSDLTLTAIFTPDEV